MWGDKEGLILLFLYFGVLKLSLSLDEWWWRGAESVIKSRLKSQFIVFLVLFKDAGHWVSPRFHHFILRKLFKIENVLWKWCVRVCLDCECVELVVSG